MSRYRVCFLGTPQFAEVHLKALLKNNQFEVVGVVTQPDRPAGRKMQLTASPVKLLALENNIQVLTPESLRKEPENLKIIKSWEADVAVVVAFGQILSQEFLDSFKFGAVNVHGSLLPKWRGAAPIQRSIEAGDKITGVSLQQMVRKLDAGPVIAERHVVLNDEITATELYEQLSVLGAELLTNEFLNFLNGEIQPQAQDENQVTLAAKIEKEESLIDWNLSAICIHNRIRAFSMGPGTYVMLQGKRFKIHKSKVLAVSDTKFTAGQVVEINSNELIIQTGQGQLSLLEVQPESKPKIPIKDYLKNIIVAGNLHKGDQFV